jgi:hypothetical protein
VEKAEQVLSKQIINIIKLLCSAVRCTCAECCKVHDTADGLKLEQSLTQNTNIRLDTGKTETTKKSLYVEMDERINSILSDYSKEDLKE